MEAVLAGTAAEHGAVRGAIRISEVVRGLRRKHNDFRLQPVDVYERPGDTHRKPEPSWTRAP